jgi:hypothetical protein
MVDPFTLGAIVLSYTLHIGHIGYTIYKNEPDIKTEIVKIEHDDFENPTNLSDDIKKIGIEIHNTIELIQKSESENNIKL